MDNNMVDSEILNNLKETLQKEKEIFSIFKVIKGKMNGDKLLKALVKSDLDSIRKTLNITGTSSLKKNELAEHIDNYIKDNLQRIFKNYITVSELQYISLIVENGGVYEYVHNDDNYRIIRALKLLGLCFPINHNKENKVVIPIDYLEEIKVIINSKEVENIIINNNKIVRIIKGLLYYYGVASFDVLWDKIKESLDFEMDKEMAFSFISNYANRNNSIKMYKNNLYISELFNVEHILLEQAKRNDLDYQDFDINTILFACDNIKNVWTASEKNLYDYLKSLIDEDDEKIEHIVNSCIYGVKNDYKLPELLNFLTSSIIFQNQVQVFELAKFVNEIYNNCNLWALKGHISKVADKNNSVVVINKVGRNDKCPCGSGKKYKKCCGKN